MAATTIRNFIAKALFKKKGAIASSKAVDFSAKALEQRIKNLGINPNEIRSEQELNQILAYVKQVEDQAFDARFGNMLAGSKFDKQADVLDMTGKKLDPDKGIMGGTQTTDDLKETITENLMKTDNPFSDLVKTTEKGPKTLKEREAEVLARMNKENKEAAQRIRDRKRLEDRAIEDFVDDAGGVNPDDPRGIDDFIPDPEDMATGGRAGFKSGLGKGFFEFLKKFKVKQSGDDLKDFLSKRQFMKDMVGNTEKNRKARQLAEIKEAMKDAKGYQFPSGEELRKDIEKVIQPILNKGRKLNATGGRAGFSKGSGLKTLFDFLNKKSPMKAYTDYLNSIKTRMKAGKEAEVAGEVIPIAAGGALITNQLKKKLKAMNEEQKKEFKKDMEKKANGGRAGYADGTGAPSIKYDFDKEQEPMGPTFETNDPEEALKEIVKRMINVEPAKIPLSENMQLMFDLDRAQIGGQKDIGGGELSFGINKGFGRDDTGMGFNFRKKFKDGSDMNRRSFLKILGGLASIPILGKFLKPVKTAKGIKSVPIIKTDNVPGKPEWFDALVNKVILEGDDVTKKFATADRQSIHSKTLDDGSVVRVTEDVDNGAVRVEYESEANVYGDPVQMEYRKPLPDEGAPNPAAEFSTAESGPVGRQASPDDYELDVDEIGGSSISDLDSDVSKLKEFATGKNPTLREMVQNKKRKDKAARITDDTDGAASDAVVRRQGEYYPDDDGLASGGIARMLGE